MRKAVCGTSAIRTSALPMANWNASAWQNNSVLSTTSLRKKPDSKRRCFWPKSINLPLHRKPQSRLPRSSSPFIFPTRSNGPGRLHIAATKSYGGEIKPFCEGLWTRDARTRHVQAILEAMAKTNRFNINSLKHIKSFLSGSSGLLFSKAITRAQIPFAKLLCPRFDQRTRHTLIPSKRFLR